MNFSQGLTPDASFFKFIVHNQPKISHKVEMDTEFNPAKFQHGRSAMCRENKNICSIVKYFQTTTCGLVTRDCIIL